MVGCEMTILMIHSFIMRTDVDEFFGDDYTKLQRG